MVCWLHNVASKLELRSLQSGNLRQEVPLPGVGSVRGFSGRRVDSEMFFSYSSFTDPGSIFMCTHAAHAPISLSSCNRSNMGAMHRQSPLERRLSTTQSQSCLRLLR